jgi:hypothetical protein
MIKILRKIFVYILFIQIVIVLVTIFQIANLVRELGSISRVETIAKYTTGDYFGGSTLLIKGDNTFFYSRGTDCCPGPEVLGFWNKLNDTLVLNSEKECTYVRDSNDFKWVEEDCIKFKNAKFILYPDSIVFISGISDINNSMKLNKFK